MDVHDIGINQAALFCNTDKTDCCGEVPNRVGEWYYPNGTKVGTEGGSQADEFYRNRGTQVIRLNRRNDIVTGRHPGLFRCEVPDADNITQNIYINIGMLSISLLEMQ